MLQALRWRGASLTRTLIVNQRLPTASTSRPTYFAYRLLTPTQGGTSTRAFSSSTSDASSTSKPESKNASRTTGSQRSLAQEQTLEWEDKVNYNVVDKFSDLPYRHLGYNQHMIINEEFKKALGDIVKSFQAPIIYAFAYGSGVFPQSKLLGKAPSDELLRSVHTKPDPAIVRAQGESPKMIDFIFGVSHTQHWHSLNMRQNRHHYSAVASLGSGFVSRVQDRYGAGVYFNPYVNVNGTLIKYGVVNVDTLCRDLTEWDTLYLSGRLHKPVKIIRDNARVRLANQTNLVAAIRTALLMLPEEFTEQELYSLIAGLSYLGDPRMRFPTENPRKVGNIVNNNKIHFRNLYAPLIRVLPNVRFLVDDPETADPAQDLRMRQAMSDETRGNMVRRLPKQFRSRVYFQYQKKWQISRADFNAATENLHTEEGGITFGTRLGGEFDQRIAKDDEAERREILRAVIKQTTSWPSTAQSLKGIVMSGFGRSWRDLGEKMSKYREGKKPLPAPETDGGKSDPKSISSSSSESLSEEKTQDAHKPKSQ